MSCCRLLINPPEYTREESYSLASLNASRPRPLAMAWLSLAPVSSALYLLRGVGRSYTVATYDGLEAAAPARADCRVCLKSAHLPYWSFLRHSQRRSTGRAWIGCCCCCLGVVAVLCAFPSQMLRPCSRLVLHRREGGGYVGCFLVECLVFINAYIGVQRRTGRMEHTSQGTAALASREVSQRKAQNKYNAPTSKKKTSQKRRRRLCVCVLRGPSSYVLT